jgi:outer membrane protein assembly factor BamB
VVIVGGSSDNLYAVDGDTGKILWQKKFTAEGTPKNPSHWLCHNGLNATPAITREGALSTVYTIASDGKLHALSVVNGEDRFPPTQFVPAYSKNWSLNIVDNVLYTTISQGCNGAKSGVYAMDLKTPERAITVFESAPHGCGVWGRRGGGFERRRVCRNG